MAYLLEANADMLFNPTSVFECGDGTGANDSHSSRSLQSLEWKTSIDASTGKTRDDAERTAIDYRL